MAKEVVGATFGEGEVVSTVIDLTSIDGADGWEHSNVGLDVSIDGIEFVSLNLVTHVVMQLFVR